MPQKKKKAASNPARGFATSSLPSRPRPNTEVNVASNADALPASKVSSGQAIKKSELSNGVGNASTSSKEPDISTLSPDELEKRLEEADILRFVEQNAAKVHQNSARTAAKFSTEKRVFRKQADYFPIASFLTEETVVEILRNVEYAARFKSKDFRSVEWHIREEDVTKRLWALFEALGGLGFSKSTIDQTLGQALLERPLLDTPSDGLEEALHIAADLLSEEQLPAYNQTTLEVGPLHTSDESEPVQIEASKGENNRKGRDEAPVPSIDGELVGNPEQESDVSDVPSDSEPNELVSVYLKIKERLYRRNPEALEEVHRKNRKAAPKSPGGVQLTPGQKKLRDQISHIESDILLNKQEADAMWALRKNELAQEAAQRRRLHLTDDTRKGAKVSGPSENGDAKNGHGRLPHKTEETEASDDDGILSGMFASGDDLSMPTALVQDSTNVQIRDFGGSAGLSPRRVLEEACRARDSASKVTLTLISPTTYASRHSCSIVWSKSQNRLKVSAIEGVGIHEAGETSQIRMETIATPDVKQSEAFICTVALFALFFDSTSKEEKSFMRLPSQWRGLWNELAICEQEKNESLDCATVAELRNLLNKTKGILKTKEIPEAAPPEQKANASNGASGQHHTEKGTRSDLEKLQSLWATTSSLPSFQNMLKGRMNLPIYQFREEILQTVNENQITILCGETGCGKSTQVPSYILEQELSQGRNCNIYCTQPRRISAISLAQRVSAELGERKQDLGTSRSLIGYVIRLESRSSSQTKLTYVTVGIVLRMLESGNSLDGITHLILDEVHERSIDTDFLLIILRKLMLKRPDLKVILMSATVDAGKFSAYLNGAPILTVPGRTFPVQAQFLEDAVELTNYKNQRSGAEELESEGRESASENDQHGNTGNLQTYSVATRNVLKEFDEYRIDYDLIIKLLSHVAYSPAFAEFSDAILVFLPGLAEIRRLNDMLSGHSSFMKGWIVHMLHSSIASEDQQAAFVIPPKGSRKIVLSTDIAETGVTIPDITCVIDTAKHKEMRYDERRQMSRLIQTFISRANAKQRRGRAGRVREGLCFHLITKHRHDKVIAEQQSPEMLRLSLQELIMRVKIVGLGDIQETLGQALDPPSAKNVRRAIDALIEVDALTSNEDLTELGKQLAKLPLDAHLGKLVLAGAMFGCLDFAITTAACLSSKSPFLTPIAQKERADAARLAFSKGSSDLLTTYNAYNGWRRVCQRGEGEFQYCRKNFLSPQALGNIEDLKGQLLSATEAAEFVTLNAAERQELSRARWTGKKRHFVPVLAAYNIGNENLVLNNCTTAWAFYPKILVRDGKGWRNIANNQPVSLYPSSVNRAEKPIAKYLSFYHILQASNKFTNAHETSPAPDLALVLLCGDVDFRLYSGVITVDGNRMKVAVDKWKTMLALKNLSQALRAGLQRRLKAPHKPLPENLQSALDIWLKMCDAAAQAQQDKDSRMKKNA